MQWRGVVFWGGGGVSNNSRTHPPPSPLSRVSFACPPAQLCIWKVPEIKLGVEADGPTHYMYQPNGKFTRNGTTNFKYRQLAALGWHCVSIPYYEYQRLAGHAPQRQYLLERVGGFISGAVAKLKSLSRLHETVNAGRASNSGSGGDGGCGDGGDAGGRGGGGRALEDPRLSAMARLQNRWGVPEEAQQQPGREGDPRVGSRWGVPEEAQHHSGREGDPRVGSRWVEGRNVVLMEEGPGQQLERQWGPERQWDPARGDVWAAARTDTLENGGGVTTDGRYWGMHPTFSVHESGPGRDPAIDATASSWRRGADPPCMESWHASANQEVQRSKRSIDEVDL